MSIEFKITDNSKEILSKEQKALETALEAIGLKAENFAKKDCPVDTGRLRNSISHQVEPDGVYIGTNVEYAPFVEYGDNIKHTTGKAHFLRDAATMHGDLYKNIVMKALKGTTQ